MLQTLSPLGRKNSHIIISLMALMQKSQMRKVLTESKVFCFLRIQDYSSILAPSCLCLQFMPLSNL